MKKLVFLFLSLLTAGSLFQACDNSKTYAEMLEDEKNAVNKFIKDNDIRVNPILTFLFPATIYDLHIYAVGKSNIFVISIPSFF